MIDVYFFVIDEDNMEKFWIHGVSSAQILEVLERPMTVVRNRKGRRASHIVIGRDRSGMCLAIPIEATSDPGIWRPVTAWPCKPSERVRLPRDR